MQKCPTTVAIVGWVLIVWGGLVLFVSFELLSRPGVIWTILGGLSQLVSGTFILGGANWARILYVASVAFFTAAWVGSPGSVLDGLIFNLPLVVILFLPKANAFFR